MCVSFKACDSKVNQLVKAGLVVNMSKCIKSSRVKGRDQEGQLFEQLSNNLVHVKRVEFGAVIQQVCSER